MEKHKLQISFDFVLTIMVFITLVTYFLFYLLSQRNISISGLRREEKFLKAVSISQLLTDEYGYPKNWEIAPKASIKRIGFLNESYSYPNYISRTKVVRLMNDFCNTSSDYSLLKDILGLEKYNVMIIVKFSDGTLHSCPSPLLDVSLGSPENVTRKVFDSENNQTVTIFVAVGD